MSWMILLFFSLISFDCQSMKITNAIEISKISSTPLSYNCSIYSHEDEDLEIHCRGNGLMEIPSDLNKTVNKLDISESRNIEIIRNSSLQFYKNKLKDVTLSDLPNLTEIEEGTFSNISSLRTIYIHNAPKFKSIDGLFKGVIAKHFKSLRITNTGLHQVPELFYLTPENPMFLLDLDHNKINKLASNSIKVTALQVTLNFNEITKIEDYAFNGSQIGELHITTNPKLVELGENAFNGVQNLRELDLSLTSIKTLPSIGLETLEILKIRETPSLHTIPSLYELKGLRIAKLTHHFHCCAFKYPEQHDPIRSAAYVDYKKQMCIQNHDFKRRKRAFDYLNHTQRHLLRSTSNQNNSSVTLNMAGITTPQSPLTGHFIDHQKPIENNNKEEDDDFGTFFPIPTIINLTHIEILCGNSSFKLQDVKCNPEPNALNPCEDIMGFTWLRNSVWFVVILAVVGNVAVVFVISFSKTEINVSRYLICNLAFADLCMGLYLLLIASMDYHSVGTYFNFAYDWQYGISCQIAGFLTVFSGHLSIFTLTVVTIERWFAIKYAIDLTKRITLKLAIKIMIFGWLYSILMAALPLFGISNYSSTSICLPMEVKSFIDKFYLSSIFLINGLSLAMIVFCYTQIYFSLGYETRRASHKGEMTIAKKMALLIFVDFATYTPVAFFGICALIGYPLINITKSKILLVFFYPLNACANPYLYALMTSQYRRDLFVIISRCGICKQKARQYCLRDGIPVGSKPSPLLSTNQENINLYFNNDYRITQNGNGNRDNNSRTVNAYV